MAGYRFVDRAIQPVFSFLLVTGEAGVLLAVVPWVESAAHDGIDLAWDRVLRGEEGGLVPSSARIPGTVMPSFQGCAGGFHSFFQSIELT